MSQITIWFRLIVDWHESAWLAELPWEVRAVWPVVLGHVKQHGRGGICRQPITARFCAAYDIPVTVVTALCNAAERDGALRVTDGNWEITHWEAYQREDPTNTERQRRHREKKRAEKGKSEPEQPQLDPEESDRNALRNGCHDPITQITPTVQYNTVQDNTRQENSAKPSKVSREPPPEPRSKKKPKGSAPIQPNGNIADGKGKHRFATEDEEVAFKQAQIEAIKRQREGGGT